MPKQNARERLEAALARIDDPKGEGARACLTVYREAAKAAADAADARAKAGISLGPLDGAIVSHQGPVRRRRRSHARRLQGAGRGRRAGRARRARRAAPARGRRVIVAKTNMSEFAFTGIGANPHYGTPGNPADRARAPGGSSSGAAVAVADGMCEIAIGSDTGGSVRIPSSICGVTGFKPSRQRVPTEGAFPLSYTLDSIGPLAQQYRRLRQSRRGDGGRGAVRRWKPRRSPACGSASRKGCRSKISTTPSASAFPFALDAAGEGGRAASASRSCRCSTR